MENEKLNYLEFPAQDINKTKAFFNEVFNWQFVDYGPEYTAFAKQDTGMDGGFYLSKNNSKVSNGSVLVVFYAKELTKTMDKIVTAGGTISTPPFEFPGGCRFHFLDPNGNEFAVWSET